MNCIQYKPVELGFPSASPHISMDYSCRVCGCFFSRPQDCQVHINQKLDRKHIAYRKIQSRKIEQHFHKTVEAATSAKRSALLSTLFLVATT